VAVLRLSRSEVRLAGKVAMEMGFLRETEMVENIYGNFGILFRYDQLIYFGFLFILIFYQLYF
jgi:hypothetical protein